MSILCKVLGPQFTLILRNNDGCATGQSGAPVTADFEEEKQFGKHGCPRCERRKQVGHQSSFYVDFPGPQNSRSAAARIFQTRPPQFPSHVFSQHCDWDPLCPALDWGGGAQRVAEVTLHASGGQVIKSSTASTCSLETFPLEPRHTRRGHPGHVLRVPGGGPDNGPAEVPEDGSISPQT